MSEQVSRRTLLGAATGLVAAGLAGRSAAGTDEVDRLFRTGIIIDGNLAAPLDDSAPLDAEMAAKVRASGLTATKVTVVGPGAGYDETVATLAACGRAVTLSAGVYAVARSIADIEALRGSGRVGLIWSFETTEMLEGRLDRIDEFAALGVKVMQLSYNTASPFASGVMTPQSTGLTSLGREAIARMEAHGVALDLSHSDERSSLEALATATRPAMISHAGAAAIHNHPRNKSDRLLKAVADAGGVVGIYDLSYLTPGPAQPDVEDYMRHLMHALNVCGEDHVGIGSDAVLSGFDTSAESLKQWDASTAARKAAGVAAPDEGRPPYVEGLNRPDRMKVIAAQLLSRGVREPAVAKILGGNFLRVYRQSWTA